MKDINEIKNVKELRSLRSEQLEIADKALEEEKPDEAKEAMAEIKKIDERLSKVEEELGLDKKDEEPKEKEPEGKQPEFNNIEPKGAKRNMDKIITPKINEEQESAEVRDFIHFLRTKGEKRANVTSLEADIIIPKDIATQPVKLPETIVDLKQYTNVVKVPTAQGSYPILESATTKMIPVAELAKNPELAHPTFLDVDYKVETYRGQIAISEESLQDSTPDLANIVAENNARIGLNTTNDAIATVLKGFAPKEIDGTDGVKDILNVAIDPAYNVMVVASQTFFNKLDKLKDEQGQYILQNDITSPSGRSLFGRKVDVISDSLLGAPGEAKAFIGDVSQAVMFADRAQASVRWIDNEIYGQLLAISQRFDVVPADPNAGFFVSYVDPVEPAPTV
ncbi:phage major capsid protein [Staphylococcus succinus]|uniref:phage major capsid protein n=1 Tax=Staphylococcus succinus TaxID=61015 RepID=UPI00301E549D